MLDQLSYSTDGNQFEVRALQKGLLEAFAAAFGAHALGFSSEKLLRDLQWRADQKAGFIDASMIEAVFGGTAMQLIPRPKEIFLQPQMSTLDLPLVVLLRDYRAVLIEHSDDGYRLFDGSQSYRVERSIASLVDEAVTLWSMQPREGRHDSRVDHYLPPQGQNWLRETLFPSFKPYGYVLGASFICNLLALAGMIFSMQIYDRVIPAASFPTLIVLTVGVCIAFVFEFLIRSSRGHLLDYLGKNAGLRLSERVFGHALRLKTQARPNSTGSFLAQLRDIDMLREQLTSSAVTAVMDIPFFLLFLVIMISVAGWLALIPVVALLLMVIPAIACQGRLKRLAQGAQREAALRNAILVEAVQGADDIKALKAEARFDEIWRQTSLATSDASMRQKRLVTGLTSWTQTVQQGVYAATVAIGAPLVMSGALTTGTVIGASILSARMLGPLSQIAGVLVRWQQTKVSISALEQVMQKPTDHLSTEQPVHLAELEGRIDMRGLRYGYAGKDQPALHIDQLRFAPGERVGVLGRNGSGKSTLLKALAGMILPSEGQYLLDGHQIGTIDAADLRRDFHLLGAQARLFHGSLRDNLRLAMPLATDAKLIQVLKSVAGEGFLAGFPKGLDYEIAEGGGGLSSGQRQQILIARSLLSKPKVLLLDEPSAAMDEVSERALIQHLTSLPPSQGLFLVTHRMRLLQAVDRLVVLRGGRIVLDGPKEVVLAQLRGSEA